MDIETLLTIFRAKCILQYERKAQARAHTHACKIIMQQNPLRAPPDWSSPTIRDNSRSMQVPSMQVVNASTTCIECRNRANKSHQRVRIFAAHSTSRLVAGRL
jgi:hypothetical protein